MARDRLAARKVDEIAMIKEILKSVCHYMNIFGLDPVRAIASCRGAPAYIADYLKFRKQRPPGDNPFKYGRLYPCLNDRFGGSGQVKGHYFHQDLLVASKIFANRPESHVDIGSRVDGFVAHVASFREIFVVDIRPLASNIKNIKFLQADLMDKIPAELVESCDSISCLHALEHFGLGRYGDPVRWDGYRVGFDNLLTMLKPGGKFYFSVPIGEQRIEFNAHRVFSIAYLLGMFANRLRIDNFSFVDDGGNLHENVEIDGQNIKINFGCCYGCGIFELTKF